jgi:hypothetical protein
MRRILIGLVAVAALHGQTAVIRDLSHTSQVLNGPRTYQALIPPAYETSQKRYPVIYWLNGYEQPDEHRDSEIAAFVAAHDVIVVKAGPVETVGEFPLYFPELMGEVDRSLRTAADRGHRGITGVAMAGFMALYLAGKYPDLIGSASSFTGYTGAPIGPRNLETDLSLDNMFGNYDGVRTRVVTGGSAALSFYQRRLNGLWLLGADAHETDDSPEIAKTLDFHMRAFAAPLPKPSSFQHADVYPDFSVWGWEVLSERRQPGFTLLQNVSARGFRSSIREWIPGGATLPSTKLSVVSAPVYPPRSAQNVTYTRLRDGQVRRAALKADPQGRLTFDLDGDVWETAVSSEAMLTVDSWTLADASWATAGPPFALRVKLRNAGQARSATSTIQFESPNGGVKIEPATGRVYALAPGETAVVPLTITVIEPSHALVRIFAVDGAWRIPIDIPLFPAAPSVKDFHISDGQSIEVYRHAVQTGEMKLGEGNGDGQAAPGESFAILLPDGGAMRAGELFTTDPCVDTSERGLDSWDDYDRAGVPAMYTLASVRQDCEPGHIVHALVRVLLPDYQTRYAAIEFPVWYRNPK